MARQRMHKPELVSHVPFLECSVIGRLLFIQLQNFCDDHGNHPFSGRAIKAEVFPADDFTVAQIEGLIEELIKKGLVAKYSAGNQQYLHVLGWEIEGHPCYQVINKPQPSTYPKYDEFATTGTLPEPLPEQSGLIEDKINEDKIKENNICADAPTSAPPPAGVIEKSKKENPGFERLREIYPNKTDRKQAEVAFKKIIGNDDVLLDRAVSAVAAQIRERETLRQYGQFVPEWRTLERWLKAAKWEDVVKTEAEIMVLAPQPRQGVLRHGETDHVAEARRLAREKAAFEEKKLQDAEEAKKDQEWWERRQKWEQNYPDLLGILDKKIERGGGMPAWIAACQKRDAEVGITQ